MKTLSAEHAKSELSRLVQQSVKGHETFRITHESGEAVLLSREDYDVLIETLEALSDSDLQGRVAATGRRAG